MAEDLIAITCDKDETWAYSPEIPTNGKQDYEGQSIYFVDASLMNAYLAAQNLTTYLRNQIIAAVHPTD